jgi:hypothetical protein
VQPEGTPPPISDLCKALDILADRVSIPGPLGLEPVDVLALRHILEDLSRYIPGLEPPPDPEAAEAMERSAEAAFRRGDEREALARALRGLSFSPHDPALFYLAASACFEIGALEAAMRLLYHTLWIHPGHPAARDDLEALTSFLGDQNPEDLAA